MTLIQVHISNFSSNTKLFFTIQLDFWSNTFKYYINFLYFSLVPARKLTKISQQSKENVQTTVKKFVRMII